MVKLNPHSVKCVRCGTVFEALRAEARYCSVACRVGALRERKQQASAKQRTSAKQTTRASAASSSDATIDKLRKELQALRAENAELRAQVNSAKKATAETTTNAELETLRAMAESAVMFSHANRALSAENEELSRKVRELKRELDAKPRRPAGITTTGKTTATFKWDRSAYDLIRGCLHSDRAPDPRRLDKAFSTFQACVKRPAK